MEAFDAMILSWWAWLIVGLLLLGLELLTPGGFYLMFFGVSAIVVAVLAAIGLVQPLWAQLLLFSVLAVAGLALFRETLVEVLRRGMPTRDLDSLSGEIARALDDVAVEGNGQVELRGSPWKARNVGHEEIVRGQECRVVRVDGLTLWVRGV